MSRTSGYSALIADLIALTSAAVLVGIALAILLSFPFLHSRDAMQLQREAGTQRPIEQRLSHDVT